MSSKLKAVKPKEVSPGKLKAILYGPPGVGKTWLSLDFPSVYYIDAEGGARLSHYQDKLLGAGGMYMGPDEGASDFASVIEEVKTLATEKHTYRTLVIDSGSKLFKLAVASEAERLKAANMKNEYSIDKKPAIAFARRLSNFISKLDMNVWLICHEKAEYKNNEVVGLEPDYWSDYAYDIELCLHMQRAAASRYLWVKKSRLQGFPDGDRFPATYQELTQRYGKDSIEAFSSPMHLATEVQLSELTKLLSFLKVEESDVEKWHAKAKASCFAEYQSDQIEKLINSLKARIK